MSEMLSAPRWVFTKLAACRRLSLSPTSMQSSSRSMRTLFSTSMLSARTLAGMPDRNSLPVMKSRSLDPKYNVAPPSELISRTEAGETKLPKSEPDAPIARVPVGILAKTDTSRVRDRAQMLASYYRLPLIKDELEADLILLIGGRRVAVKETGPDHYLAFVDFFRDLYALNWYEFPGICLQYRATMLSFLSVGRGLVVDVTVRFFFLLHLFVARAHRSVWATARSTEPRLCVRCSTSLPVPTPTSTAYE